MEIHYQAQLKQVLHYDQQQSVYIQFVQVHRVLSEDVPVGIFTSQQVYVYHE